jgi:anti-sigma factor RsiW
VSGRNHDDVVELLGAYALHAVDADERNLVDEHLVECPKCRAELHDHEQVATLLGNTGGDAPEGLWDRIAGALEEAPPPMRLDLPAGRGVVVPLAGRRRPAGRAAVALVAAAAALVIAVLGVKVVNQEDRIGRLQTAMEDTAIVRAANLALADPHAAKARLASLDGSVTAAAVVLPDGSGYLLAQDMPALDRGKTYQLWGQTGGGLISLGLLGSHPNDVVAFQSTKGVAALAITEEDAPGVVQSKNPPALSGSFD